MDKNDNIVMISKDIRANERYIRERLADCGDIQIRKMRLGDERKVDCLMVYIEVATSNMMLEDSAIGKMVGHFWEISPGEMQEFVEYNSLGIADVKKLTDMEQVFAGLLAGNVHSLVYIIGEDFAVMPLKPMAGDAGQTVAAVFRCACPDAVHLVFNTEIIDVLCQGVRIVNLAEGDGGRFGAVERGGQVDVIRFVKILYA